MNVKKLLGFILTCSILNAMDSAGLRGQVVVYFDTFRKKMVLAEILQLVSPHSQLHKIANNNWPFHRF